MTSSESRKSDARKSVKVAEPMKQPERELTEELLRALRGDDLHPEVLDYFLREGCCTVGAFCCWVDDVRDWNATLQGAVFPSVKRKHIAHVKDCWERLRVLTRTPPEQLVSASLGLSVGHVHAAPRITSLMHTDTLTDTEDGHEHGHGHGHGIGHGLDEGHAHANGRDLDECDDDVETQPDFWKELIGIHAVDTKHERENDDWTVEDLCMIFSMRVEDIFVRHDNDGDTLIDPIELSQALNALGFEVDGEGARQIVQHMREMPGGHAIDSAGRITRRLFERMINWLRLAELFVPDAGRFRWNADTGSEMCSITYVDYNADNFHEDKLFSLGSSQRFFFGGKRPFGCGTTSCSTSPVHKWGRRGARWIHMEAMDGLDRLGLLRLAVRYELHPLAVNDILENTVQTKVERYGGHYIVTTEILSLARPKPKAARRTTARDRITQIVDSDVIEPPRVKIHRSHVTMFLQQPPMCETLVTIHQSSVERSAWLDIWRHHEESQSEEQSALFTQDVLCLWEDLRRDLRAGATKKIKTLKPRQTHHKNADDGVQDQRPAKRMREEPADFLLYEVLHRIVLQLRPITEAYAKRLGYMNQLPPRLLSQEYMQEVAEIKLEVYDFLRTIRPLKQVVKHFTEESQLSSLARMYLDDVVDDVDSMAHDAGHLTRMAEALELAHERYADKQTNDTLFLLSMVTTIFMPLQFITGWYGMNFQTMPELSWGTEDDPDTLITGYQYLWILMAGVFVIAVCSVCFTAYGLAPCRVMSSTCRMCGCRLQRSRKTLPPGFTRELE